MGWAVVRAMRECSSMQLGPSERLQRYKLMTENTLTHHLDTGTFPTAPVVRPSDRAFECMSCVPVEEW